LTRLAIWRNRGHIQTMAAIHLIFEVQQIGDDWQLRVHGSGTEIEYIKGFPSKAAAEKWPASRDGQAWREMRGYAK
jgi:hypothetical protein